MALSVEVAELVEHFQCLTQARSFDLSPEKKVKEEIGDALIYLTNLADKLEIDPVEAAHETVEKDRVNYPVGKAKGNALKYREYSI